MAKLDRALVKWCLISDDFALLNDVELMYVRCFCIYYLKNYPEADDRTEIIAKLAIIDCIIDSKIKA